MIQRSSFGSFRRLGWISPLLCLSIVAQAMPTWAQDPQAQGTPIPFENIILQALTAEDTPALTDGGLHVILVGTGTPRPDRVSPCVAIIAAGEVLLFDVGPGAYKYVERANIPGDYLTSIFLTHFHWDHMGGVDHAVAASWTFGRTVPVEVYGPPGVTEIVEGFTDAYRLDAGYRNKNQSALGRLPMDAAFGKPHPFDVEGDELKLVLDRNGLRVFAFNVAHQPVEPAVGYRIEYAGKSVVISGDTRKSDNLIRHAKGADILIHEAMNKGMMNNVLAVTRKHGLDDQTRQFQQLLDYHTDVNECAEIAAEAGVEKLVLTHLIPAPDNPMIKQMFALGLDQIFQGEIVVGEDGMRFDLVPLAEGAAPVVAE